MRIETYLHDDSPACWCRPIVENLGRTMVVTHRDIPESSLAGRIDAITNESEHEAASWTNRGPSETTAVEV